MAEKIRPEDKQKLLLAVLRAFNATADELTTKGGVRYRNSDEDNRRSDVFEITLDALARTIKAMPEYTEEDIQRMEQIRQCKSKRTRRKKMD